MDLLSQALSNNASWFLDEAIERELDHFLERFDQMRDADGLHAVVRNGRQPQRCVLTGIGSLPVRIPKIRTRTGEPIAFRSMLVPAYRRCASTGDVSRASIGRYLRGILDRNFGDALAAVLGGRAVFLVPGLARDIGSLWVRQCEELCAGSLASHAWKLIRAHSVHLEFDEGGSRRHVCAIIMVGVKEAGAAQLLGIRRCSGDARRSWAEALDDLGSRGVAWPSVVEVGRRAAEFAQAWQSVVSRPDTQVRALPAQAFEDRVKVAYESVLGPAPPVAHCPACGNGPAQCGPGKSLGSGHPEEAAAT